ncbi:dialkylresorcinol condensing enzyme [Pseudoalteromonas shioyasakiensis]|uniref:dialkylrecorsinol condensing enzyme n=1 Tax=Pseudoalteromonas shioyasakiensis TaxID=1190813 RepID=UPI0021198759|nr:dialkylrecorsinol condensing enzyme [Pseudoalteromonas shioyasakiensis]MCQ8878469.1 dialkylresorcinol condensing enzyme [Pseudoalteromonas shioyasakiensis]
MRKVLVIHYSQTGQLTQIADSIVAPIKAGDDIIVDYLNLKPSQPFPFPWPFLTFFHIFPECVKMTPQPMELIAPAHDDYDLVILTYQVWFLSPSLPISSFMQSEQAIKLLNNKPVITVIGCRGMWLSAQEKMKQLLSNVNAKLIDNVVLSDECGTGFSFLATPLWMFSGKKKSVSWVPAAGVAQHEITAASRFGVAIKKALLTLDPGHTLDKPVLKGLGAVKVNEKFIASERVGQHSFKIWSKILATLGPMHSTRRSCGLLIYVLFLLTLIITVVPITALIKKLIAPLTRKRIAKQKAYFAEPSGE